MSLFFPGRGSAFVLACPQWQGQGTASLKFARRVGHKLTSSSRPFQSSALDCSFWRCCPDCLPSLLGSVDTTNVLAPAVILLKAAAGKAARRQCWLDLWQVDNIRLRPSKDCEKCFFFRSCTLLNLGCSAGRTSRGTSGICGWMGRPNKPVSWIRAWSWQTWTKLSRNCRWLERACSCRVGARNGCELSRRKKGPGLRYRPLTY